MRTVEFPIAIGPAHPALPGHFPGNPIVPGALLLDHLFAGLRAETGLGVRRLDQARFIAALLPGESARAHCSVDGTRVDFHLRALREGVSTVLANGRLTLEGGPDATPGRDDVATP